MPLFAGSRPSGGGYNPGSWQDIYNQGMGNIGPNTSYQGPATLAPGRGGGGRGGMYMPNVGMAGWPISHVNQTVNPYRISENTDYGPQAALAGQAMQLAQRDARFNTIFPYLTGQLGARSNQPAAQVQGSERQGPEITVRPIYDEAQIQQQVNSMRARNDMSLASRMNESQRALGGQGFAGRSPALEATRARLLAANTAANTQGELDMRTQLAGANAQQILRGQSARDQQFQGMANRQLQRDITNAELINRQRQLEYNFNQGLLSILGGLA